MNYNGYSITGINLNEMVKLGAGLMARGIEFTTQGFNNGMQIVCNGWDAVCHDFSYGHERGLIEVMGIMSNDDMDVVGWLTAQEILDWLDNK